MGPDHRGVGRLGRQHRGRAWRPSGGRAGFVGKIADDELGQVFIHDIRACGVEFHPAIAGGPDDGGPVDAKRSAPAAAWCW